MNDPWQVIRGYLTAQVIFYAVAILVALVVLYVLWQVLTRRKPKPLIPEPDLTVDVATLEQGGPPPGTPSLECYHIPVRLAVVVLAPAGRGRTLPPPEQLERVLDAMVPGLAAVVAAHRPRLHRWPEQLSVTGFARRFFANVRLPGQAGKGTPWCVLAGPFHVDEHTAVAGLVLSAAAANSLGQVLIERDSQWLDVLRIKTE